MYRQQDGFRDWGLGDTHGLLLLGRSGKNKPGVQHQKCGVRYEKEREKTSSLQKNCLYVSKRLLQSPFPTKPV